MKGPTQEPKTDVTVEVLPSCGSVRSMCFCATQLAWNQPSMSIVSKKKKVVSDWRKLLTVVQCNRNPHGGSAKTECEYLQPGTGRGSANHEGAFKRDGCWMRASLAAGVSTDIPPPTRVNSRGLQGASDIEAQDKHTSACHNTVNWSLAWLVNQIFFFSA